MPAHRSCSVYPATISFHTSSHASNQHTCSVLSVLLFSCTLVSAVGHVMAVIIVSLPANSTTTSGHTLFNASSFFSSLPMTNGRAFFGFSTE